MAQSNTVMCCHQVGIVWNTAFQSSSTEAQTGAMLMRKPVLHIVLDSHVTVNQHCCLEHFVLLFNYIPGKGEFILPCLLDQRKDYYLDQLKCRSALWWKDRHRTEGFYTVF